MGMSMAAASVPRIFSQSRRLARARRHTALSAASSPEDQFLRAHLAEEVMDRLDFMRLEACPTLVLGDAPGDLPGALIHLRRALLPGGLLLACITGAGTLATLRHALLVADGDRPAARVHPQIDNQIASGLMARAGFNRQVVDSHALPVTYRSLDRLLTDLRLQGLTSVLADAPPPLTRAGLKSN